MSDLEMIQRTDLERVKRNGLYLQYVSEQTPEICRAAISQNENARKYVNISLDQEPESKEEMEENEL